MLYLPTYMFSLKYVFVYIHTHTHDSVDMWWSNKMTMSAWSSSKNDKTCGLKKYEKNRWRNTKTENISTKHFFIFLDIVFHICFHKDVETCVWISVCWRVELPACRWPSNCLERERKRERERERGRKTAVERDTKKQRQRETGRRQEWREDKNQALAQEYPSKWIFWKANRCTCTRPTSSSRHVIMEEMESIVVERVLMCIMLQILLSLSIVSIFCCCAIQASALGLLRDAPCTAHAQ